MRAIENWAEDLQIEPGEISERGRWIVMAVLAIATLGCGIVAGLIA